MRTPSGVVPASTPAPSEAEPRRCGTVVSRSMPQRKAARVLPEPVGAQIRVLWPAAIEAQPPAWAGVGPSNEEENHRLTGSENGASACFAVGFASVANRSILRRSLGGPARAPWLLAAGPVTV